MLVLSATTQSLEILLAGAKSATDPAYTSTYADNTGAVFTEGQKDGTLNGTTAVTVVAAPGASTRRVIKEVIVYNDDDAEITLTFRLNNNGSYRNLSTKTLTPGDTWRWTDGPLGAKGDKGSSGTSGTSGSSGSSGTSGPSGSSGTSGADGDMTNPMTTAGDIIYGGASGVPTRLAKGTAGQALVMNSGATAPEWGDAGVSGARVNKTEAASPYSVTTADLNGLTVFTNTGATGETAFNQPAGADGLRGRAIVTAAQYLKLVANGSEKFRFLGTQSAAGGYVRSNVVGNVIEFDWSGTEWVITGIGGAWTYDS